MTRSVPWRRVPRSLIALTIGASAGLKLLSPTSAVHAISVSPSDLLALHAPAVLAATVLLEAVVAWSSGHAPRSLAGRAVPLAFVLLLVATRALDLLPTCACFGPLSAQIPRDTVLGALLALAAADWWLQPTAAPGPGGGRLDGLVLAAILLGGGLAAAAATRVGVEPSVDLAVRAMRVQRDAGTGTVRISGEVVNLSPDRVRDVRLVPACPACVRSARGDELPSLGSGESAAFEIVEDVAADRGPTGPGLHVWFTAGRRSHRIWVPYPAR